MDGIFTSGNSSFLDNLYKGKKYEIGIYRWFSSSETGNFVNTHYADEWDSAYAELEKLGAEVNYKDSGGNIVTADVINNPYPSKLRPIDNMNYLRKLKNICIYQIHFEAYNVLKSGSSYQDADINTTIIDSHANTANNYVDTRFLNAQPVTWQPNFFRPKVYINGINIFESIAKNNFDRNPRGEMSLGIKLPVVFESRALFEDAIQSIDALAAVRQRVIYNSEVWFKAYPVMMYMVVTYQKN